MTVLEFSNEFDIAYNSIATNSAPGIDLYEKSVYLTRAQLELVNQYFNPKGNKYSDGFENSSKRRNDLNELIKNEVSVTQIFSISGISSDSRFFKILDDVYLILQEKVYVTSRTDACVNKTYIKVKPITHDEFNIQEENPFKEPDKSVAWRLDHSTQGTNKNVELISPYTVTKYRYRYVKYPDPIILSNFTNSFPGENLTVDGVSIAQTCSLSPSIHREILNRAVELATADYKPQDLPVKAQINNRNE